MANAEPNIRLALDAFPETVQKKLSPDLCTPKIGLNLQWSPPHIVAG
jgi:hypothetical protein